MGVKSKKSITQWLGLGLIVFALTFIPLLVYVPFMPLSIKKKAVLIAALVIGGQVLTGVGGILLGREILVRYHKYLNPRNWFKKKDTNK
jgi:hypothetical protein